jgi:hypothetical protein
MRWLIPAGFAVLCVACGDTRTPTTPAAPTNPGAPTVTELKLSVDHELRVGASAAQATVRASFSDGSSSDVTQASDWRSSDEAVASVARGVIEPKGVGETELSATYGGRRASVVVRVGARAFDVTGKVLNTFSDEAVAGALVVIDNGADVGKSTRAGSDGVFTFAGLTSLDALFHVEAEGYERERDRLSAPGPIVVRMEPARTTSQWTGTFQAMDRWIGWSGDVPVTIHHTGPVTLKLTAGCVTFGTYGEANVAINRQAGLAVPLSVQSGAYPGMPLPNAGTFVYERSAILPAGDYQLSAASAGVGWSGCPWTITLSRPE